MEFEEHTILDLCRWTIKKYKGRKLKILLVNDDNFALFTISTTLHKFGKIDKATNGQEAFEMVSQHAQD
jgi:CheY-like chemotaxis protein